MKFYTGVGSRETPKEIGYKIVKIASKLEELGYTLRSGGADGADSYFEQGSIKKEIYVPWKGFNKRTDIIIPIVNKDLVKEVHPNFDALSEAAIKLHSRNFFQVLGQDLFTPSKFLICWAKTDKEGIPTGGTRTAWVVAQKYNIPCFNLYKEEDYNRILKLIE